MLFPTPVHDHNNIIGNDYYEIPDSIYPTHRKNDAQARSSVNQLPQKGNSLKDELDLKAKASAPAGTNQSMYLIEQPKTTFRSTDLTFSTSLQDDNSNKKTCSRLAN